MVVDGDAQADETGDPGPLFGAALAIAPGYMIELPRARLRVGLRLELSGSFALDQGPTVIGINVSAPEQSMAAFRLGGLELGSALTLTTWFPAS